MRLEYIFIPKYRSFTNQGFDLSNEFIIEFSVESSVIKIKQNPLYISNFFGPNILSYTGIIGENGSGKSTFLNYIKEVLAMPKYNEDHCQCLLIFYKKEIDKFIVIDNLPGNSNIKVNVENQRSSYEIMKLKDLIPNGKEEQEYDLHYTVLESVKDLRDLGIIYLSTFFEPERIEKSYGPPRMPLIFNLSTNYLYKEGLNNNQYNYSTSEASNILSFIVNARDTIPDFKLPDLANIYINYPTIYQTFNIDEASPSLSARIKGKEKKKKIYPLNAESTIEGLLKLESEILYRDNKRELIKFWLHLNFLAEIYSLIMHDKLEEFLNKISTKDTDSFFSSMLAALNNTGEYLEDKILNQEQSGWKAYFDAYKSYIEIILLLQDNDKLGSTENHQIKVILNSENILILKELLELKRTVTFKSTSFINFTWGPTSSGEAAMLTIFSRLYFLHKELVQEEQNVITKLWLLLDECDTSFHPQWEKQFNYLIIQFINKYFPDIEIQVIFTTHSPFSISDLPKKNLIFIKKGAKGLTVQNSLNEHKQTFAANINVLLTDSFFMNNGLIGEFANKKINTIIDLLLEGSLEEIIENQESIERTINCIGEPIVKNKLLTIMQNRVRANLIQIKSDIENLKKGK